MQQPTPSPRWNSVIAALAVSLAFHALVFVVSTSRHAPLAPASGTPIELVMQRVPPRVTPPQVQVGSSSPAPKRPGRKVVPPPPPVTPAPVVTPPAPPPEVAQSAPSPPAVAPVMEDGPPAAGTGGTGPGLDAPGLRKPPSLTLSTRSAMELMAPLLSSEEAARPAVLDDATFTQKPYLDSVNKQVSVGWRPENALDSALAAGTLLAGAYSTGVMVEVDGAGEAVAVRVVEKSGLDFLDEEAAKTIRLIQHFPPPPKELLTTGQHWFLPIRFKVRVVPPGQHEQALENLLPNPMLQSGLWRATKELALPLPDPLTIAGTPATRRLVHSMCHKLEDVCTGCDQGWTRYSAIYQPCGLEGVGPPSR